MSREVVHPPGGREPAGAQLWGGRFQGAADPLFRAFNDSLGFDWALVHEDIRGSIAWAEGLGGAGVLSADEVALLTDALERLSAEAGQLGAAPIDQGDEDVHSWVERRLVDMIGSLGKKLHTGRSRNDQVSTDLRLWSRRHAGERIAEIRELQSSLVELAERYAADAIPGYTHLQRAQPITIGHWALAYFEMLDRDAARFADAVDRLNRCPLGSAALAGTAYPVDSERIADLLGFDGPTTNSLDAVSARDFVLELLSAASICAVHLSRLAEELIIFNSSEFGFVEMDDAVTSGSSIMPQKKNPDACELVRGKAGRVTGSLVSLLMTVKGLSLAYNKDLQEDKEPLFDAFGHLSMSLRMTERVISGLRFHTPRCREACLDGYANATELADYLVGKGVPFRDAHEVVGRTVRAAIEAGSRLEDMPLETLRGIHEAIGEDVFSALSVEVALSRRMAVGGSSPRRVREAIVEARDRLETSQLNAEGQA